MPPKASQHQDLVDIWDAPWALLPGVWGRRVLILARGARGDLQPICVLGARLVSEGCHVLVLTNADQVQFVRSFGLRAEGTQHPWSLEARPNLTLEFAREVFEAEKRVANRFRPDLLYDCAFEYNGNAQRLSELLRVPMVRGVVRADFQHAYEMPGFTTKLDVLDSCERPPLLNQTYLHYSRILWKVPPELADSHLLTGFLAVPEQEQLRRLKLEDPLFGGASKASVEAFLQLGRAPVCATFGSMEGPLGSTEFFAKLVTTIMVRALLQARLRGILVGGAVPLEKRFLDEKDADLHAYAEENILFVPSAPHGWLLPRCSLVVHHGGIGTAAAALRAGLPSVALLLTAHRDQVWNANLLQSMGCGLAAHGDALKADPFHLSTVISWCATSGAMRERCEAMRNRLEQEDGAANAVAAIDRFMVEQVDSGAWAECMDAYLAEKRPVLQGIREKGGRPCANSALCGLRATWHGEFCCAACAWGQGHGPKCDKEPLVPPPAAEEPEEPEEPEDNQVEPTYIEE